MGGPVDLLVLLNLLLDALVGFLPLLVFFGIVFRAGATEAAHHICEKTRSPVRF